MSKLNVDLTVRILRIILKHVVEEIPIYGRTMRLTVEIAEAIQEEVKRDLGLNLDKSEIGKAVGGLPRKAVRNEVENALSARSDLSPESRSALRDELERVPVRFGKIVAEIEAAEAQRRREEHQEKVRWLIEQIESGVRDNNYYLAYLYLIDLRKTGTWDRDLSRLERFLFRRSHDVYTSARDWITAGALLVALAVGVWMQKGCLAGCLFIGVSIWWSTLVKTLLPALEWAWVPLTARKPIAILAVSLPFLALVAWLVFLIANSQ
jgi:hypothetical protein